MTESMETSYANTDFDVKSKLPFDTLHNELAAGCLVLHYGQGDDGHYYASFESDHEHETTQANADSDIRLIMNVIDTLSDNAKSELETCYLREFNIGFNCGDTWAYGHSLTKELLATVAEAGCSLAMTLYPMRHQDGPPRV